MSQLILKGHRGRQFKLNVRQFRSPMGAQITSAQTRSMLQHFPIRAGQPDINFTVMFRSQASKAEFQSFVRDHQINAQTEGDDGAVVLWWPERNIENWRGFITEYHVVDRGLREPAPSVTFGVALTRSLMSEVTTLFSLGSHWSAIWGPQIGPSRPNANDIDSVIRPPTPPSSQTPTGPDGTPTYPNTPPPYEGGGSF